MTIRDLVRAYLLADPAIADIVAARVYPQRPPQGATYPLALISQASGVRYPTLRGRQNLARPRYQIDAWARSQPEALALGHLILQRLEGFSGILVDDSVSPSVERRVWAEYIDGRDLFDPDIHGGAFGYSQDFFIWHQGQSI